VLPSGSLVDSSDVVRALHVALAAIDRQVRQCERISSLPDNAGKPWCGEDDAELVQSFDSGRPVADLAAAFRRTRGSIASRLVRLRKVPDRQSAFVANLPPISNGH
jgi:hypothetical protein